MKLTLRSYRRNNPGLCLPDVTPVTEMAELYVKHAMVTDNLDISSNLLFLCKCI